MNAQRYNATGIKVGSEYSITGLDVTEIEATILADGCVSITYTYGSNIYMEIIDVRDTASTTGVSTNNYVVGTIGNDVLFGAGLGFESVFGWDGNDTLGFSGGGLDVVTESIRSTLRPLPIVTKLILILE